MSESHILTLVAPARLEETLTDWLLDNGRQDFLSYLVQGHAGNVAGLSITEQVSGRTAQIRFDVRVTREESRALLNALQTNLPGTGIQYWISPLAQAGQT